VLPGGTFTYEFTLKQNGTYFYHSHFAMQEMMGMIGLFIIHPKNAFSPKVDRDFGLILMRQMTMDHPIASTLSSLVWLRRAISSSKPIALQKNPTLAQAEAAIRSAQGKQRQAGAYPNPIVSFSNNEISRGPVIRGGEYGVTVQQEIVLGGKLGLSQRVAELDIVKAQSQAEAQKLKVLNAVRSFFYQALAVQRKLDVRTRLAALIQDAVTTSRQLRNVGQADVPDVLEIEIEQQNAELAVIGARNEQQQVWTQLAAAVGDSSLRLQPLAGDLEQIPAIDTESALATILRDSPEVKAANADVRRAEFAVRQAQRQNIPNLLIEAGGHYNRELLEAGGRPVGMQGSFSIGMQIPLFNRNQGNVEAARGDLTRAQREVERVQLSLQSRLAAAIRDYQDTRNIVVRYRNEMLPRARRAYDLYLASFRQKAAAYPQALIAQRTLLQLQEDYDNAWISLWRRAVDIQGLLLEGGLHAPGFAFESPGN
jgi:cobalt-zinc-cadmium efflux system outer membrane protein